MTPTTEIYLLTSAGYLNLKAPAVYGMTFKFTSNNLTYSQHACQSLL